MNIERTKYGILDSGEEVYSFELSNEKVKVRIHELGNTIHSIETKDKNGIWGNIVLSYPNLEGYVNDNLFLGVTVGQYANRIEGSKFSIDDVDYQLENNDNGNHLHGGKFGFHKAKWKGEIKRGDGNIFLKMKLKRKEDESSYPGNLDIEVVYFLNNELLEISYLAVTDKKTIINMTNHSYFNLDGSENILDHEVKINAETFTPVKKNLIPTGEIRNTKNSSFDFSKMKSVGANIEDSDEQLKFVGGYDHNFVIAKSKLDLGLAAVVKSNSSGRIVEVYCTQPGIQFYTGNFLSGKFKHRSALCLEPQYFPNSPNQEKFEMKYTTPEKKYYEVIKYKFITENL